MKAIILAAGRGSRMKSLTSANPKCLVELRGEPLLRHQLNSLSEGGIDEIAIVTGYRAQMLDSYTDQTFHNPRWAETNMVSSLARADDWLRSGPCIVSYSDIFYEPQAVSSLAACAASLAITYDPNWEKLWTNRFEDPLSDAETFRKSDEGQLLEIGKRPQSTTEVEGQYMGLLRFTPQGWGEMQIMRAELTDAERDRLDMTSALQRLVERGNTPIACVPYTGDWGEVDSAEDLAVYQGNQTDR